MRSVRRSGHGRHKEHAHQLATAQVAEMLTSGQVSLDQYRQFVQAHTRFLKYARDLERQLWMNYAHKDALTGTLNRKIMDGLLELERQKSRATGQPCLLVMVDIDHFKLVNDTYGHANGDVVLRAVALTIRESTRQSDVVFRYGGEEFLICMPGLSLRSGIRHVEKLRLALAEQAIGISGASPISVTASFGMAEFVRDCSVSDVIATADAALYRAKEGGRNQINYH